MLERKHGPADREAMAEADEIDLPSVKDDDDASSDEETVKGEREPMAQFNETIVDSSPTTPFPPMTTENGFLLNRGMKMTGKMAEAAQEDEDGVTNILPARANSPSVSLLSVPPDDTPSVQGSVISSPSSSILPSGASRPDLNSPTPSLRPFDRRFQPRITSSSNIGSLRPSSLTFLSSHSRPASASSQLGLNSQDIEASSPPWEVMRWTKLEKLNSQAFSESSRRNFGAPTCMAVSVSIVLGTSKGIILMFDYNQSLKMVLGPGSKAVESGGITSIAVSADHTTVAGGHANGSIFTWDTTKGASRPFLSIPHLDPSQMQKRTMDGHISNVAITHLGFLGTRHTALVSADGRGMAFSHLATRGTGALGRTVKTTRILGRYPDAPAPAAGKPPKPSTVLAFSSLPLGNVEKATDAMGLTAMLTPYLLVIVSTTPIAQTQHKSARSKGVAAHSAMTGCLAWFPAVKLKVRDPHSSSHISKVKLAYCWSNVLTVLDVDEISTEDDDKYPPSLEFKVRNRWECDEAIVAVQWLGRSVLTVLTISQRLIVIEERSMRMTEAFDLIHKHIHHADLFSKQLQTLVEQLDENDTCMHGVVADAFYMSFKAYKGRLFLMGFNEVSLGTLANWTNRLIALMEHGDYLAAIQLATSYYTGDANKLTVGLPEDTSLRHSMVKDKLLEIMRASFKYAFGHRAKDRRAADKNHLRKLAEACFAACHSVQDVGFLFDDMYEWYEDAGMEGIFLETLEPYILELKILSVPPIAVRAMVSHFVGKGLENRLEEMVCHMDTTTLDLDQITHLCKQNSLFDALIYVWNQALRDFITPLIDLLALLVPPVQNGGEPRNMLEGESARAKALKMFPYLSCVLTGRIYPTGERIPDDAATQAKAELYWFLFSGKSITWPKGNQESFRTRPGQLQEPSFPYLRLILDFDAPSFLSVLNEAFEDSFLNEMPDSVSNRNAERELSEEQTFGLTVDRQYIVTILMEIMNPTDFAPDDRIYLDMFIARNLPKYPQYLIFTGSTLTRVLTALCQYPGDDVAEDAQLSAEYLLSVHDPPDLPALIPLLKNAGFYRILKRIYRTDKQYGKLIQTYFEDPDDREAVFGAIENCLRPQAVLARRQVQDVQQVILQHARDLVLLDPAQAAKTMAACVPELHRAVLDAAAEDPDLQYEYLKMLLEPSGGQAGQVDRELIEDYLQLMCQFNPSHVSEYVGMLQSTDLRLEKVLPCMEKTGVIDAAVVLMAHEGHVQEAAARLTKHLGTLESAFQGLFGESALDSSTVRSSAHDLLHAMQKYTLVGIWLCQEQTKAARQTCTLRKRQKCSNKDALSDDEQLWLELIDVTVQMTRRLSPLLTEQPVDDTGRVQQLDTDRLLGLLRSLVQPIFTALLTSTSSGTSSSAPATPATVEVTSNMSFLRILRAFLTCAATKSPNLADLRAVLGSIFSAYAYGENILRLANRLLERSLFMSVHQASKLRQRGWRPRGSTCEACGRRVWGPGVAGDVFGAWEEMERRRREIRKVVKIEEGGEGGQWAGGGGKGKGRAKAVGLSVNVGVMADKGQKTVREEGGGDVKAEEEGDGTQIRGGPGKNEPAVSPLVVLACRHIYHQSCLDSMQASNWGSSAAAGMDPYGVDRRYRCPIDG